ncbi:MAG: hypothetical protein ACQETL_19640 [Bacteroidota bacterium]
MNSFLSSLIILLVFTMLPNAMLGQSDPNVISSIKERYYSITNEESQLNVININDFDFYMKDMTISIVKTEYEDGQLEFYYVPAAKEGYILYFIFFDHNEESDKPDYRVYLNDEGRVVLTKFDQKEVSYINNRNKINNLILESNNALNTFFNLFELAKNHKDSTINQILHEAVETDKRIAKTDTLDYFNGEDGGHYEEGEFVFYDSENQRIKSLAYHAGEHGSGWRTTYFSNGRRICVVDEKATWSPYFNLTVGITYYRRGSIEIRRDYYNSQGVKPSSGGSFGKLFHYDLSNIVPQIEYN